MKTAASLERRVSLHQAGCLKTSHLVANRKPPLEPWSMRGRDHQGSGNALAPVRAVIHPRTPRCRSHSATFAIRPSPALCFLPLPGLQNRHPQGLRKTQPGRFAGRAGGLPQGRLDQIQISKGADQSRMEIAGLRLWISARQVGPAPLTPQGRIRRWDKVGNACRIRVNVPFARLITPFRTLLKMA